jgi:hypothetical protein
MTTKLAIAIDLDRLRALAQEHIIAMGGDGSNDIMERLTLSSFIEWLRQEKTNETQTNRTKKTADSTTTISPTKDSLFVPDGRI